MAELEEYLRKGKNCTLTEGMIQKILELASNYGDSQYDEGKQTGAESEYWFQKDHCSCSS